MTKDFLKRILHGTPTMPPVESAPAPEGSSLTGDVEAADPAEPREAGISVPELQPGNRRDAEWRGDWQLPLGAFVLVAILFVIFLLVHR